VWDCHSFEQEYLERSYMVIRAFYPAPFAPSARQLEDLRDMAGATCHIDLLTVKDEDWKDNWKAYYHTTRTGRNLVIKPSWEDYSGQEGDLIIELDPGMAFGTGTHTTTRQCLELLEASAVEGRRVLDIGTGSGILAIASAKLGAGEVIAIDNDPVAVEVARQNVRHNAVSSQVTVEHEDLDDFSRPDFDLVAANLTAPVLSSLISRIISLTRPGGGIIMAGIGREQWPDFKETLEKTGLTLDQVSREEDWVAVLARRS
jgi:ribosomal protein L11 methyltransferase